MSQLTQQEKIAFEEDEKVTASKTLTGNQLQVDSKKCQDIMEQAIRGKFDPKLPPLTASEVAKRQIMAMRTNGFIPEPPQDLFSTILQWHKDVCPEPKLSDKIVARACMYEELKEYAQECGDTVYDHLFQVSQFYYANANGEFKDIYIRNKKAHLDALCDIIVVAIQDGYRSGYDMMGALAEVVRSNESKRLDDGTLPRNEAGKVIKTSPNYFEADVTPFIGE